MLRELYERDDEGFGRGYKRSYKREHLHRNMTTFFSKVIV